MSTTMLGLMRTSWHAIILCLLATAISEAIATCQESPNGASAYVITIIDESRGMDNELNGLGKLLESLDDKLQVLNIGSGGVANRFSIVGFGRRYSSPSVCRTANCYAHVYTVNDETDFSIQNVDQVTSQLSTEDSTAEDGYRAIMEAFDSLNYRQRPQVGTIVIFITDEDRDVYNAPRLPLSRANIARFLGCERFALHMIVDTAIYLQGQEDIWVMGYSFSNRSIVLGDSPGAYTFRQDQNDVTINSYANTREDYINVGQSSYGTVWDINVMRFASETLKASFSNAFTSTAAESVQTVVTADYQSAATCASLAEHSRRCVCETYDGTFSSVEGVMQVPMVHGECSIDVGCQLGVWSDWSTCSVSCDEGVQSRSREVIRERRLLGPVCEPRMETRPCLLLSCDDIVVDTTMAATASTVHIASSKPASQSPTTSEPSVTSPTQAGPSNLLVEIPAPVASLPELVSYEVLIYSQANESLLLRQTVNINMAGGEVSVPTSILGDGNFTVLVVGESVAGDTYSVQQYHRAVPLQDTCLNGLQLGQKSYVQSSEDDPVALDVVFIMDESRGMSGEHLWLKDNIKSFDQDLIQTGVGSSSSLRNLYSIVAFGGSQKPRLLTTQGAEALVNTDHVANLTVQLQSEPPVDIEDSYAALHFASTNVPLRNMPGTRSIFILVTDEDRDIADTEINLDKVVESLKERNIELLIFADIIFSTSGQENTLAIGYSISSGYISSSGSTEYTATDPANFKVVYGYGNSVRDYTALASRMKASLWAINMLRFDTPSQRATLSALLNSLEGRVSQVNSLCLECSCSRPHPKSTTTSKTAMTCFLDNDSERCRCEATGAKYSTSTGQCTADKNCIVSSWSSWGACSVTCNNGTKQRTRQITQQRAGNGARCPVLTEVGDCFPEKCDVDCVVGEWHPWEQCSVSCNDGIQVRHRDIVVPQKGIGAACPRLSRTRPCRPITCPVNCSVSNWGAWSLCSKTCDRGTRIRERQVTVVQAGAGLACPALVDVAACELEPCDLDCLVTNWTDWSSCSQTCDRGYRSRSRTITRGKRFNGRPCPLLEGLESCYLVECAVDCRVSNWAAWSPCSVTCGAGTKARTRHVDEYDRGGGNECPILRTEKYCSPRECDRDCIVSAWTDWTKCSTTCDEGLQSRSRQVLVTAVENGLACPATSTRRSCNLRPCDIDCVVSDWSPWGACSKTCNDGLQTRSRTVLVEQEGNGRTCPTLTAQQPCREKLCDVDCVVSAWQPWTDCSTDCGPGLQYRSRSIEVYPVANGRSCPSQRENQACQKRLCDVNCVVSRWSSWSQCSSSCGPGTQTRSREAQTHPVANGRPCGALNMSQSCQLRYCNVDCQVSSWSNWTPCSVTCGIGVRARNRSEVVSQVALGQRCPPLNAQQLCTPRQCVLCEGRYKKGTTINRTRTDFIQPIAVEVVFVLDETSSMEPGHELTTNVVQELDERLVARGIGSSSNFPNRYALIGFGQRRAVPQLFFPHHYRSETSLLDFLTAQEFRGVARRNLYVDPQGDTEDGYLALNYVFSHLPALRRNDTRVAVQIVLLTNEDRDTVEPEGESLNRATMRRWLRRNNAFLNVLVDNELAYGSSLAYGGDNANTYVAAGNGNIRREISPVSVRTGFGSTKHDYVDLALAVGGTTWNIGFLRQSNHQASFRSSFIDSMVRQAVSYGQECQLCVCTDDGGAGEMQCRRQPHQPLCKCEANGGEFVHSSHTCRTT